MIDFLLKRQLGQSTPANTNAASIYTLTAKKLVHVSHLVVCNTSGSARTYRVFWDSDGTTYDTTTALYYDKAIDANGTEFVDIDATLEVAGGSVGIRTSNASDLTFTLFGEVRDIV